MPRERTPSPPTQIEPQPALRLADSDQRVFVQVDSTLSILQDPLACTALPCIRPITPRIKRPSNCSQQPATARLDIRLGPSCQTVKRSLCLCLCVGDHYTLRLSRSRRVLPLAGLHLPAPVLSWCLFVRWNDLATRAATTAATVFSTHLLEA